LDNCQRENSSKHGASSVADQRKGNTCHRNKFADTSNSKKYLKSIFGSQTQGNQFVKTLLNPIRYVYHQEKHTHTHQDHTDSKKASQFFANSSKHIILLNKGDQLRRAVAQSNSKPAPGSYSKESLQDLISGSLPNRKGILPGHYSLPDMSEQEISDQQLYIRCPDPPEDKSASWLLHTALPHM